MPMLEADFTDAIETFALVWQQQSSSADKDEMEWDDVLVLERVGFY